AGRAAARSAPRPAAQPAALAAAWARRRIRLLAAGAMAAAATGLAAVVALPAAMERAAPEGRWQAFDEARIGPLVSEGRTVFVDVTADWCITCRFNKAAVLERGPVAERLAGGVVAMRADWTRPDPAISAYLARFARYGIPFNAVYGPGAPAGIALPELLTDGAVLEAMDKAGRKG
ncbi:MAG: thioredoxin family protein, partial [Alphaproteobacteria bacterium]|nr:thioredoxin family protein [Alphaproteobacteria bacterium]